MCPSSIAICPAIASMTIRLVSFSKHICELTVLIVFRRDGCGCVYKGATCCRCAYRGWCMGDSLHRGKGRCCHSWRWQNRSFAHWWHYSLSNAALLPEHASWVSCPQHAHSPYFRITWEVGFNYSQVHVHQRHWWHSRRLDIRATISR